MLKVVEKKKIWFSISAIIIAVGLIAMFAKGLNFGIDFEGGTNIILKFDEEYNKEDVDSIVKGFASDAVTNTAENNEYEIKSKNFESKEVSKLVEELKKKYKMPENAIVSQEEIGASIGKELRTNSLKALAIAFVAMLIYIAVRFEFKFGVIALIALAHDLLITISVFAVFGISINSPFIAAVLTIVGYSINATIVIFDRIRENLKLSGRTSAAEVANKSVTQTMARSINTTITTLFTIVAVYIFVPTVRGFSFPIIIGIISGLFSSVFIAPSLWVLVTEKKKKSK
ncbi:MAG: protein translocase subunit SecF [Clostridium sp.]|uniref:protein translocase subunit SecF n=1 Tax=Clostridium sp. TaxID=1506 RepID=UPI0028FE4917|nr:protein translocase subunit SecF [Clostridium sp.]MDU1936234.1 protein translocase subunit SecF [Clostridium sp.]MDU2044863.1 protein translocase subunit SecF [Clostridium sp.]